MKYDVIQDWSEYLIHFSADQKDVYFSPQYAKLYESDNETAICFVHQNQEKVFLFPILKRDFEFEGEICHDFETAYGYGGPIANTSDQEFMSTALQLFFKYCSDHNFVCGFTRFHPLLQNSPSFDVVGKVLLDRQTVAIDLTQSEDEIWMQSLTSKNRSTIKKAIASGLSFEADYSFKYLDNFISLYNSTMTKLGADDFFVFDRDYYKDWIATIPNSFLGVVIHDNRIIAAAIFFYSENFGHYHLAGSDPEYLSLNPNNFMLWEAAKELRKKELQLFHLGGGSNGSPDNSLLGFKSRFSPLRFDFNIGKMVFNSEKYHRICSKWENENPEKAIQYKNLLLKYKY